MSIVLSASACRTTRTYSDTTKTLRDSVFVTEVIRDTLVRIEQDSSLVKALLECDSLGRVRIKELLDYREGVRIKPPFISIKENVLTAKAETDSMQLYLALKDRYETRISESSVRTVTTVEVNRLKPMQRFWMNTGKIAVTFLTLMLVIRVTRNKKLW